MKNIAIFASGTGSNAKRIIEYFRDNEAVGVKLVVSNRPDAPVLAMARENGVETMVIRRQQFYGDQTLLAVLETHAIDFIILAGFLWLMPAYLVEAYQGRMVNIHPALLPRYGGKGMYGMNVHRAVKASGDTVSGITIHYVNEQYDDGDIVFQARCTVDPADSPEDIARKVQQLEHRYFAPVIEKLLQGQPVGMDAPPS